MSAGEYPGSFVRASATSLLAVAGLAGLLAGSGIALWTDSEIKASVTSIHRKLHRVEEEVLFLGSTCSRIFATPMHLLPSTTRS